MQPEFWLARWHAGEIGWHEPAINSHLREYWPALGLAPGARVFVPLCGKSLDLLWLAAQGYEVIGVELSEIGVRAFFAENGLEARVTDLAPFTAYRCDELTLLCGDFFDLRPQHLGALDAVFDRASLIALPPEMRPRYAQHLRALAPRAVSLLITLDYDPREMRGPPFAVGGDEVRGLFADHYAVSPLASYAALEDAPHFRKRGLTALQECVWRLDPSAGG